MREIRLEFDRMISAIFVKSIDTMRKWIWKINEIMAKKKQIDWMMEMLESEKIVEAQIVEPSSFVLHRSAVVVVVEVATFATVGTVALLLVAVL